jgi:hypothetical protein
LQERQELQRMPVLEEVGQPPESVTLPPGDNRVHVVPHRLIGSILETTPNLVECDVRTFNLKLI